MTRDEAINLIHSAWRPGEKSGHRRILYLLGLLGNPHKSLRFVHIAGTNGKGSTAAMLDSILREAGFEPGNVDATIVAQAPKLAPHIPAMRRNIAAAMGLDTSCVSVKATTEERLGFTGEGLGIAAQAAALIDG